MNWIKQPNKILSVILMLIILLVPLLNLPDRYLNLPRMYILYTSALIIIIILIINWKKIRFDYIDKILLIFLMLIIISTIFSIDIKNSILGKTNFYEGSLMIFVYALCYYVAKHFMIFNKKILYFMLIQSVIISVIGILQFYGIGTSMNLSFINGPSGFAFGTFGYHNYFGSYITLFFTLSVYLFILSKKKLYLVISLIHFSAMLASMTRSAWLACFISLMIILISFKDFKELKKIVILLILFTIPLILIYKTNIGVAWKLDIFKTDIETLFNEGISDKLGSERIWIWKNTLGILNDNKLTGVGLENFSKALEEHCLSQKNQCLERFYEIGYAHNEYLQIAISAGVPAIIIYILFLFSNLSSAIKDKSVNLLLVPVIGYMIQAFFNISIIAIAPIFWIFLGLMMNKEFNEKLSFELGQN